MTDRNEEGMTGYRKTQGNRVPRIEVVGDICLKRSRSIKSCRSDDDDDYDDDDNNNNNLNKMNFQKKKNFTEHKMSVFSFSQNILFYSQFRKILL